MEAVVYGAPLLAGKCSVPCDVRRAADPPDGEGTMRERASRAGKKRKLLRCQLLHLRCCAQLHGMGVQGC